MLHPTLLDKYNSNLSQEFLREKIEGKKILVMGSGPSVDLRNWANVDFDYIATVSFWYNRPDLLERSDIFFTAYSDLVDLGNPNLLAYLDTHDTIVGIEEYQGAFCNSTKFKDFKQRYEDRYVDFRVKFRREEKYMGLAGRLMYFMLNYSPDTLYYVGLDGVSNSPQNDPSNAFRSGYRPEVVAGGSGSRNQNNIENSHLFMAQTLDVESKKRGVKVFNLGEGLPFNMSGKYSKAHYPLTEEIIKLITK